MQVSWRGVAAFRLLTATLLLAALSCAAVLWALPAREAGAQTAPSERDFQQVTLAKGAGVIGEPIGMTVLPDRRVLTTSRDGSIYLVTPDAKVSLAGKIPVYSHDEDGLQGIAVDPDFERNGWVYAYYAPPLNTPGGDAPNDGTGPETFAPYKGHNQLSRFKMTGDTIDLGSEQKLLEVETDRGQCCHAGGEMDFDAEGNLYLSTGDDTNPFQSDGYTPIDERPTRNPVFDAQRSSANTNVLSGKLLRIKPDPTAASYTIPSGNLFAPGTDKTRPEIYAMGFRNPFRFDVDPATGDVLLGDYGPDAGGASATRGPGGQVEFNLIKEAGNYGWPYCTGDNDAYNDYDFATGRSGAKFDCQNPVNDSPNNTGLRQLPPAEPAWIPYDNCSVPEFGCGSESPMGGPTYRFDENLQSDTKFPEYYDGKQFIYDWGRRWIKTVTENPDGSPGEIEPFFDSMTRTQVMNLEFGPEGSLYVLDYGTGFFSGDANSALYRIDHVAGNRAPTAVSSATPDSGPTPLTVRFSSEGSGDPDEGDTIAKYEWDFDNDGTVDSTEANPTFVYERGGNYTARLTVTDTTGKTGTSTENITVGNTRPTITIEEPVHGGFFSYRSSIDIKVTVTDAEDGRIDCSKVKVDTALGHNEHTHGDQNFNGCEGTVTIPAPWEDQTQKSFYLVNASYTDGGGPNGGAPLTTTAQHVLQPKTVQAEHFTGSKDIGVYGKVTGQGGKSVGSIEDNDWISYGPMNLTNVQSVVYRTTSNGVGGTIEMRAGAPDGPLVARTQVAYNGDWDNFAPTQPTPVTDPGGATEMFFVFEKPDGAASGDPLFDVDSIRMVGKGVDANGAPEINAATATPQRGEAPLKVNFSSNATEPEGEQISYRWDFGVPGTDADTATTPNASYTYDQPGSYTATLTATDPGGRSDTRSFKIGAFAPSAPCLTPQSDDFEGATLDKGRWSEIVREDASGYGVEDGSLVLPTVRSDLYGAANGAPNLILQPMPEGPWRVTTKMNFNPTANYQKAGLLVYGDDDNWLSSNLVFAGSKRFEFLRETNGNVRNDPTTDQKEVPTDFPDDYWVRMTSDGTNVTASYSTDKQSWTPFGRPADLRGIQNPRIGVFAVRSNEDSAQIDARFDDFEFVTPSDEFDGTGLMGCRWSNIVRENQAGYRVADGSLKINTGDNTDMYGGNTSAENLILQPQPGGSWEATTRVTLDFQNTYEQAGMMVYGNDREWVKLSYIQMPEGRKIEFVRQQNGEPESGGTQDRTPVLGADVPNTVFLRITSDGTELRSAWSVDGESWTDLGRAPLAGIPDPHVGLAGFHGLGSDNEASFEFFRVAENAAPRVSATATPARGDAPLRVDFDGTATDSKGQPLKYEWDFESDGTVDATTEDATFTYNEPGTYKATFTATTADGRKASSSTEVVVGEPCATPSEPEAGYKSLFDGTDASLRDWKQSGGGGFERRGCAMKSVGDFGLFWHTNGGREFEAPYSLKLEWMKPGDDNSGVFVGFGDPGNDPFNAVREGEEVQIDSTDNPAQTTGAIYLEQAADEAARDAALRSDGQWNEYEIKVEPDRIVVILNGVKINEWIDDDPNVDLATGFIGVQSHGFSGSDPDEVFFRNIRINDGSTPVDAEAPETTITDGPSGSTNDSSATFAFGSSEANSTFECSLDGAAFAACESPESFEGLSNGEHTFAVRATDAAGNADATPESRTWTVDSGRPIVREPNPRDGSKTRDRTPRIGATVLDRADDLSKRDIELYVDGRRVWSFDYYEGSDKLRWTPGRPLDYGRHTVRVVAEDPAGNRAARAWDFRVVRP